MTSSLKSTLSKPWIYFSATFLWTWGICSIVILQAFLNPEYNSLPLLLLAMIGPGVTGILFTYLTKSKSEIRDYWRRVVSIRQIPIFWLVTVIILPFLLQILAGFVDGVSGGEGLNWGESFSAFLLNPFSHLLTIFIISLVPFFEELGWRGYAQDQLQKHYSAAKASIILGLVWSFWHLPASFIPGTYQAGLGIGTLEFWLHFIGIVFLSIVISWIYINTNRSILVMVIFHITINTSGELIKLSEAGETIFTFCWISAALAILLGLGKEMRLNPKRAQAVSISRTGLYIWMILSGSLMGSLLPVHSASSQPLPTRFQKEINLIQKEYDLTGITAAYIETDGTVQVAVSGMADREYEIQMLPDTRMLAASIGKMWVAAAAVKLHMDEVIDLDSPINHWLGERPWIKQLPNHDEITIRHLLTHTSGLSNHVESERFQSFLREHWTEMDTAVSPENLVSYIVNQPALFKPGESWHYTDTGYILAGLVLEEATGEDIYKIIQQSFMDPLKLTLTSPSDRLKLNGLASGYLAEENAFGLPVKTTTSPGVMAWHPGIEWTGGGFISNPKDLVAWAKYYFEGHVMSGDYLSLVLDAVPIHKSHQEIQYGMGVAIHTDGKFGTTYGHGGWIPGYCSSLRYFPDKRMAFAFQINTDIDLTDPTSTTLEEIETRLSRILFNSDKKQTQTQTLNMKENRHENR
jgi:D-alanyl-D-alanine carboxypeptidase